MQTTCFRIDEAGHLDSVDLATVVAGIRAGGGRFWIRAESVDPATRKSLITDLGFPPAVVDDLLEADHATRILPLDNGFFFDFPFQVSGDPPELRSALILCTEQLLLTLRRDPLVGTDPFADYTNVSATQPSDSTTDLLSELLVDASVDLRRVSSELRTRTVVYSRRLDDDPRSVSLDEILALKQSIVDLDAVSEERAALLAMLQTTDRALLDMSRHADALRIALGNTTATVRRVERLDRRAADLQLRYDSFQQEKINRRLSRLTVISAIFLPLTLIAGIYGMNFDVMPELHQPLGYPLTIATMVLVGAGLIWWFRTRGWID